MNNCFALAFSLTVITAAKLYFVLISCWSLGQFSFMNQCGIVFNCIPIDQFIFCFGSSIFVPLKYLFEDILFVFNYYQCLRNSTSINAIFTVFAAWISIFDNHGINNHALSNFYKNSKYYVGWCIDHLRNLCLRFFFRFSKYLVQY